MRSHLTRKRLLDAAARILAEESLSDMSIDRVAACAGLSRRTFFLHFTSKDQLLSAVLERLRPGQAEIVRRWNDGLAPDLTVEQRIMEMFRKIVAWISDPSWRGCAFLRVSAEFGERSGHPVHAVAAASYRDMEAWFEQELRTGGYPAPTVTARQISVLIKGLLVMQLVHRRRAHGEAALDMLPVVLAAGRTLHQSGNMQPGKEKTSIT